MKAASKADPLDRRRLARAFGFEPIKPWGPIAGVGATVLLPQFWIVGGALAVGIVAVIVDENRKIGDGLREVDNWGFPVVGYRDWLLAANPVFDIELRREVSVDLLAGSLHAVDPSIAVSRRSERVARVTMKRVELEGPQQQPTFLVGDRKRLFEVRDRVLAPLHADVGIVTVRMGDADTLAALVPLTKEEGGGAAFRDQAINAPPDLQSLAHAGTAHLAPPQEARSLRLRQDRLLFALGRVPVTSGMLTLTLVGAMIVGGIFTAGASLGAGLGFLIGGGAGSFGVWGMRRSDRRRIDQEVAQFTRRAFPIDGFENWLLSGRPQFDIELERAVDPAYLAKLLESATHKVTLTWLSDVVVRVETEPTIHMAGHGIKSFWGGNPYVFDELIGRIAKAMIGIRAVRMGGYLDRRL